MNVDHPNDERERDLAATDDVALVRYQRKWERKLERLQRAHPERWRVRGLSDEEVRDALTLRLLEVVRGDRAVYAEYARPHRDFGLCVLERRLAELRQSFRLEVLPVDFSDAPLLQRPPTPEQRFLDLEADACRSQATESATAQLNHAQRRWLSAMKLAANAGAFFERSSELNLSAAARLLDKDRSSAQRAYASLTACFTRELERFK